MPRIGTSALNALLAALLGVGFVAGGAVAQETVERTTMLDGGWVGQIGTLYLTLPVRLLRSDGADGRRIGARPALDAGMGLPGDVLVGSRIAFESAALPTGGTEWELFARYRPLTQRSGGSGVDGSISVGWNGAARSLDAEVTVARWMGPLRVIGAARGMSDLAGGGARSAVAAGAVLHPLLGSAPLAIAGDVAFLFGGSGDDPIPWSAAAQIGVPYTDNTLGIFVTNSASPTLQGSTVGASRVRVGLEITIPVFLNRIAGTVAPRPVALRSVSVPNDTTPAQPAIEATIERYLFAPKRIVVAAGTTVEWTNHDGVVHTVSAEDGAWASGAIDPGESWSARFDEPGHFLFYCGPHPFMKGEVIVR